MVYCSISISPLYLWAWINCCFATVDRNMFDNLLYCATNDRFKAVIQRESPPGLLHCLCDIERKCEQNLASSKFDCSAICTKPASCSPYQRGFLASALHMRVGKTEPVPRPWHIWKDRAVLPWALDTLAHNENSSVPFTCPPSLWAFQLREFINQVWYFWCF